MGTVIHETLIVTAPEYVFKDGFGNDAPPSLLARRIQAFRDAMPDEYRQLLVAIPSVRNNDVTFVFAPSGSKRGWGIEEECQELRERFAALFHGTYADVLRVRYGSDHDFEQGGPKLEDLSWSDEPISDDEKTAVLEARAEAAIHKILEM